MPDKRMMLSILVLCHNEAVFLRRCLRSILAQTLTARCEIILVDDASTDAGIAAAEAELAAGIRAHPGWQFRILRHDTQQGNAAAFVTALSAARGRYYHVLDGDDYWIDPDKLAVQIDRMEADPALTGIGHRTVLRRLERGEESFLPSPEPEKPVLDFADMATGGWYFHTSAMLFRNLWLTADGAPPQVPPIFREVRGDTVRLMVAASAGGIAYLPQTMSVYDDHGGGIWTALDWSGREALVQNLLARLEEHGYLAALGQKGQAWLKRGRAWLAEFQPVSLLPLSPPAVKAAPAALPEAATKAATGAATGAAAHPHRLVRVNRLTSLADLERQTRQMIAAGRHEGALMLLHRFVWALQYDARLAPLTRRRRLSSPEMDRLAQELGRQIGAAFGVLPTAETAAARAAGPLVIVVSSLDDSERGLALRDLLALWQGRGPVVVMSTEMIRSDPASQVARALAGRAEVMASPDATLTDKTAWLIHHLGRLRPSRVIAVPAPEDVVMVAGLMRQHAPEVLLFDCAASGYGAMRHSAAVSTFLLRRPWEMAYTAAIAPGVAQALLPDLSDVPPAAALAGPAWRAGGTVTALACRRAEGLEPAYDYPYDQIVPLMLAQGVARHIHIGPLGPAMQNRIHKAMLRQGQDLARFCHVKDAGAVGLACRRHGVHLMLQGFPLPEIRPLSEAMAAGVPVLLHQGYWHPMLCLADLAYPGAAVWQRPEDLVAVLRGLDAGWLASQRRACFRHVTLRRAAAMTAPDLFAPVDPSLLPRLPVAETRDDLRRLMNEILDLTVLVP